MVRSRIQRRERTRQMAISILTNSSVITIKYTQ